MKHLSLPLALALLLASLAAPRPARADDADTGVAIASGLAIAVVAVYALVGLQSDVERYSGSGRPADIEPALTSTTPIFLIAGLADLYRGSGVGYFSAHVAKNRWPKIEAHFYPEGCHGFGVSTKPHNDVYRWERLLATWLRRRGAGIKAKIDTADDAADYTPVECADE